MVTMVYPDRFDRDEAVASILRVLMQQGRMFTGSASFVYWTAAVAYALLPADPSLTLTGRRRITRGAERWIVTQTFRPRVVPVVPPVYVKACCCRYDPATCGVHASDVPMVTWGDA